MTLLRFEFLYLYSISTEQMNYKYHIKNDGSAIFVAFFASLAFLVTTFICYCRCFLSGSVNKVIVN